MAYYTPEEIQKAKQMDLYTYLANYEPEELDELTRKIMMKIHMFMLLMFIVNIRQSQQL